MSFTNKRDFGVTGGQIASHLVMNEVPTATGNPKVFTTASTVILNSIDVFWLGQLQKFGTDYVFTLGNTITIDAAAPDPDPTTLSVDYIK